MTKFEATKSVFNIPDENNSFTITRPGHWNCKYAEKTVDKLLRLLELRSQNDIELHIEQVRKKGKISVHDLALSNLGTFKNVILEELKNAKNNDPEDMVYRMQLTYDEFIDVLDKKHFAGSTIGYAPSPGIYKISDFNLLLKSLLPKR